MGSMGSMDPTTTVNPLDVYFRLMTASADGVQQSLAQTYLLVQMDVLALVALLAALLIARYALTCMPYEKRYELRLAQELEAEADAAEQRRWQQSWEQILREDPTTWPWWPHWQEAWQEAQQQAHWERTAEKARSDRRHPR